MDILESEHYVDNIVVYTIGGPALDHIKLLIKLLVFGITHLVDMVFAKPLVVFIVDGHVFSSMADDIDDIYHHNHTGGWCVQHATDEQ